MTYRIDFFRATFAIFFVGLLKRLICEIRFDFIEIECLVIEL